MVKDWASHQVTDWMSAFAEVSFSRIESEVHSAPATADLENSTGIDPGGGMTVPGYNPYNVANVDISNGRRRLIEAGNRIHDVVSDTPRVLLGIEGDMLGLEGWTFDAGIVYTKNTACTEIKRFNLTVCAAMLHLCKGRVFCLALQYLA